MKKINALIIILLLLLISCSYNTGHRLGGDLIDSHAENTIPCLRAFLQKHSNHWRFLYLEMDLLETADSQIVVFHDATLERLALNSELHFPSDSISKLTFEQVQKVKLKPDSSQIPALEEVLQIIKQNSVTKPVYLEIKNLHTGHARKQLLQLADKYQGLNLNLLAFRDNFKSSFPDQNRWCREFSSRGIEILSIGWHRNLCRL